MASATSSDRAPRRPSKSNSVFRKLGPLISGIGSRFSRNKERAFGASNTNDSEVDEGVSTPVPSNAVSETVRHTPLVTSTTLVDNGGDTRLRSETMSQLTMIESASVSEDSHKLPMKIEARAKETFAVAGRFAQTVIKKLPDLVDGNPVKTVFSIAKLIVETKNSITDNLDAIDHHMIKAAEKLNIVQAATNNGTQVPKGAESAFHRFVLQITDILKELEACKNTSWSIKVLDFENQTKKIQEIFSSILTVTDNFQIEMAISIQRTADRIDATLKMQALQSLKPIHVAHYDAEVSGKSFCRGECTPGTRTCILNDIQDWVEVASPANNIFWLTGQAGSGKTTILYTITKRVATGESTDNTRLGGTFFCSRQFAETREPNRIIPTIVCQLAQHCQPFEDALQVSYPSLSSAAFISMRTQITTLLVIPWQQCAAKRTEQRYLIVIDGLDEVDGQGASEFLQHLFEAMRSHGLGGLKFLIASRTDPNIRKQIQNFQIRKELWLQHVSADQASADVRTYLHKELSRLSPEDLERLEKYANGLFIYAATAVNFLKPGPELAASEQAVLLDRLYAYPTHTDIPSHSAFLIDSLYEQILFEAFSGIPEPLRSHRLKILHYFLSTAEREDSATVAALVGDENDEIARLVVRKLHAVFYLEKEGSVSWLHTSFPEFIFDPARSRFSYPGLNGGALATYDFSCNRADQKAILFYRCFNILNSQLKFNIANIPSSFFLDSEHYKDNLGKALVHASLHWSSYLPDSGDNIDHFAEMVSNFLQVHALFWIEVMNILDKADFCSKVLEHAERWALQRVENSSSLHADLQEASRFVSAFVREGDLCASTPHLYISHLASWSEPGGLVSKWRSNFVNLPVSTHSERDFLGVGEDGDSKKASPSSQPQFSMPLGPVWSVGFLETEPGKVVSAHSNGSIVIWDIATGESLKQVKGHEKPVRCIAVSQDGRFIVSGSNDTSVHVWSADTAELMHSLEGHTAPVRSVAVNYNGNIIVSGSHDCSVRIWNMGVVLTPVVLTGHTDWVLCVTISPDGTLIASGSKDQEVRVWDASTSDILQVFKGHTDRVNSVALTPDGTQVMSASNDHSIRLWSLSTGRSTSVLRGHSSWVNTVAIARGGSIIVSGSRDRSIRVWDARTGQLLQILYGHTDIVFSVALSQNGLHVISGSRDGSVRVWDISRRVKSVLLPSESRPKECLSTPTDARRFTWRDDNNRDDTKWIVSSNTEESEEHHRLMWRYKQAADLSNADILGSEVYGSVDFSQSIGILGKNWTECYSPFATNSDMHITS